MADIIFTQYLRPDGRVTFVKIDRPDDIVAKADAIRRAGFNLACEMLRDTTISFTVEDLENEEDLDIEICPNGPEVPIAVDRLITRVAERLTKPQH